MPNGSPDVGKKNAENVGAIDISGSRQPGIFDVSFSVDGKPKRPYLTVSSSHLAKLLLLWKLRKEHEGGNASVAPTVTDTEELPDPAEVIAALPEQERKLFKDTLYCCLARYQGLGGAGYQCAVPGTAFEAAAACGLGTTMECFASPLNCRYRRFCSAFPDIEADLGSVGSFFDDTAFDPIEGSFEANPPFIPEIMIAMGRKIERLLRADARSTHDTQFRGALSFLVVVPHWGAGASFCRTLESSRHVRAVARVPASEHAFCDGAQHTRVTTGGAGDPEMRPSSWDTAVVLLQNDAGAKRWPVDSEMLEEAFCEALRKSKGDVPARLGTIEACERTWRGKSRGGRGGRGRGSRGGGGDRGGGGNIGGRSESRAFKKPRT
mmetsp:Transcript_25147/g.58118  ORF Transcript_25147/g.58118 Transcript_25147/m.58118 type:complete len:379 (-) Transcript_25147:28-1164(-)